MLQKNVNYYAEKINFDDFSNLQQKKWTVGLNAIEKMRLSDYLKDDEFIESYKEIIVESVANGDPEYESLVRESLKQGFYSELKQLNNG